ncbi:hypothetical protein D3C80_1211680 [compost metagenome]
MLGYRNLLFGQCPQHFLQVAILIRIVHNEHFLNTGRINNIIFLFLKGNTGTHDNLFFFKVVYNNRVIVQNFFDFHDILLCIYKSIFDQRFL